MLHSVANHQLVKRKVVRQFIKFSIVGVTNVLVDGGGYIIASRLFHLNPVVAKGVSAIAAIINSFIWNRLWTFRATDDRIIPQFSRFGAVQTIGLVINTGVFSLGFTVLKLPESLSFALAIIAVTLWNFIMNKWWAFRK